MSGLEAAFALTRQDGFSVELELSIGPGETLALLGPNGAGKSTAVAAMSGLLEIEHGRVGLNGTVLDAPHEGVYVSPEDRNIGIVFQDYLLFPHLDVLENVVFGLRSRGMSAGRAREQGRSWLERVGLGAFAGRRPGDLSGGERQRVALARALAIEPDLLLLDEPLSALDVSTRGTMRRELKGHLASFAGPRLLITHDPIEAFQLADRIAIIEAGRITQVGDHTDIRLRPRTRYAAELGGSNFLAGTAEAGRARIESHILTIADKEVRGDILLTIQPHAISVHRSQPEGSPRNTWRTRIVHMESLGDTARLLTGEPLPLTAEITTASVEALSLLTGDEIWLSIKATEVHVEPTPAATGS